MQPKLIICSLIACGLIIVISRNFRTDSHPSEPTKESPPAEKTYDYITLPSAPEQPNSPTLGDQILASYGGSNSTLEQDITLFRNYLSNVFILVKQRDPRHYSTNQDLAEFLLGKRGQQEAYLSSATPVLSSNNELIDRHGSPLIIHPLSRDQIEIRSAGPDKIPYNEDDVVR